MLNEDDSPIHHVSSVARTKCNGSIVVGLFHILAHPLEAVYDVLIRISTPVLPYAIRELLPISRAACGIRCNHNIPLLCEYR